MTRTGQIRAEPRTREEDRHDETHALWERGPASSVTLPWRTARSIGKDDIEALLANARTAVFAVGDEETASRLLGPVLATAPAASRLYLYGARSLEGAQRETFSRHRSRILPRLGHPTPADWIVVDDGRAGLLLVGPPGEPRRWALPVAGAVARSLVEAFRVLFWFHAEREGLAAAGDEYSFRTPLPAPFADPGRDLPLAAGRLALDGTVDDPIDVADLRVVSEPNEARPAGTVILRPDPRDFSTAVRLAAAGSRVISLDAGLPTLSTSKQRMAMTLRAEPLTLQLEWPSADAIAVQQHLEKAAKAPAWEFHAQRRLGDVGAPVLLSGSPSETTVADKLEVPLDPVTAPLDRFEEAKPTRWPSPRQPARTIEYRWTAQPATRPPTAREAALVRQWRAMDEWARRTLDDVGALLESVERRASVTDRVRASLTGHEAFDRRRSDLDDEFLELGQSRPSRRFDERESLVDRIVALRANAVALVDDVERTYAAAEARAAEEERHAAWEKERAEAAAQLEARRRELASQRESGKASGKALRKLQSEVARLEQRAQSVFEPRTPTRPIAAARPTVPPPPSLPSEAPPELGELFEAPRGERYLAIKTWDQLPSALPEAARLRAQLVAAQ